MKTKQTINLQYVKRDNKLDDSYYRAIQREQAKRAVIRALRSSGAKLGKALWYNYAKMSDDLNGDTKMRDEFYEIFPELAPVQPVTIEQVRVVGRNSLGRFTTV